MAPQGPLFESVAGAARPTPRVMVGRLPPLSSLPARKHLPPTLDERLHPDAIYLLDSTAALAFAHIQQLPLLLKHYGQQLRVLDDVRLEWHSLAARTVSAIQPGATPEERADKHREIAVRQAAERLVAAADHLFANLVYELTMDDQAEIQDLREELAQLPRQEQFRPHGSNDRGECASVLYGEKLRREGLEVVVLCTDDRKAGGLAHNHGLGCREVADILREMARAGLVTAQAAFGFHRGAQTVARAKRQNQNRGLDYFS